MSARLMIRCPNTGEAVDTTIRGSGRMVFTNARLKCKACGEWHSWSSEDAWFEGTSEQ